MSQRWQYLIVLACFFGSGAAALVYETAWTQQFALVFGTSELAVATVLAAYMAGLTAGALAAGRWLHLVRRPVWTYAVLEAGIALAALLVPVALKLARALQLRLLGGLDLPPEASSLGPALFYLLAAFVILFLPTAMMGATLPLLARFAVQEEGQIGRRVGQLYTANTLGAAAGTVLAAFLLLPALGLGGTIGVGVLLNLLVCVLAILLVRRPRSDVASGPGWQGQGGASKSAARRSGAPAVVMWRKEGAWVLPLVLTSGFVSFSWEVLWSRLLSHVLGGSIYAFGTMLATFLLGIGLGSAAAARWAGTRRLARLGFGLAQLGIAGGSAAAFAAVDHMPGWIEALGGEGGGFLPPGALLGALLLLPGTVFVGATFPFAVRVLAGNAEEAGPASATVYAWSTLGAIAGSVGTGFLFLPALGISGVATMALVLSLLLAALGLWRCRPRLLALLPLAGLALLAFAPPATPWQVLRSSPMSGQRASGEVRYQAAGRVANVLLLEQREGWRLTTNGLPESVILPRGARIGRFTLARWLSLLPVASRPETESMLVIGLGAGLTLESAPASVRELHLVELEPEVIRANRVVASMRQRDPLADPRLVIHEHDARSALTLTDKRFDAIVSQPSHPWTAGASHLFTREFFALVSRHLQPRGVFVQWIGLRFIDRELLRSLLATLLDVFPYVEAFEPFPGGGLLLMAGAEPLAIEAGAAEGLRRGWEHWRSVGVLVPEDILLARRLDSTGAADLARGAPLATDSRNLLQTRSPRVMHQRSSLPRLRALLAQHPPDRGDPESDLYLLRQLIRLKDMDRAHSLVEGTKDVVLRRTAVALLQVAGGNRQRGLAALRELARNDPSASTAWYAVVQLSRQEILRGQEPPWLRQRLSEDGTARAVVEGWRHMAVGRSRAIEGLEAQLAEIAPRHPLHAAAIRLRITWRLASGEALRAREGLDLLEPELGRGPQGAPMLLLRARLGALAGAPDVTLSSLNELAGLGRGRNRRAGAEGQVWRQALALLRSLPPETLAGARGQRLVSELERRLGAKQAAGQEQPSG